MVDVREKLARLNPTTIRYDTGAGGIPELTNIDITHALGTVPRGLGRDLLEFLYWPDGAVLRIGQIYEGIVRVALDEQHRRRAVFSEAQTSYGLAECLATYHRDRDEASRRNLAILQAKVAVARDNLWSDKLAERLPKMAGLLLGFMQGKRYSNVEKAKALGMDESSYRERWASVYEWMLSRMIDAEAEAARAMEDSLRRDAA